MFNYIKTEKELLLNFNSIINPKNNAIYGVAYNHQWDFFYKRESIIKKELTLEDALSFSKENYKTCIVHLKSLDKLNVITVDIDNPFITFVLYANNFNFLISSPRIGHSNIILKLDKEFNENFIKQKYITTTNKIKVLDKFFLPDEKDTHRFFITLGESLSKFSDFEKVINHYQDQIENYLNVFELDFKNIEQYKVL